MRNIRPRVFVHLWRKISCQLAARTGSAHIGIPAGKRLGAALPDHIRDPVELPKNAPWAEYGLFVNVYPQVFLATSGWRWHAVAKHEHANARVDGNMLRVSMYAQATASRPSASSERCCILYEYPHCGYGLEN
jgi:hypothetical protein